MGWQIDGESNAHDHSDHRHGIEIDAPEGHVAEHACKWWICSFREARLLKSRAPLLASFVIHSSLFWAVPITCHFAKLHFKINKKLRWPVAHSPTLILAMASTTEQAALQSGIMISATVSIIPSPMPMLEMSEGLSSRYWRWNPIIVPHPHKSLLWGTLDLSASIVPLIDEI